MTMTAWMGLDLRRAYGLVGDKSCIGADELMVLADGQVLSAAGILAAVKQGHSPCFRTPPLTGDGDAWNPVIGACATRARGVEIRFHGGRSVRLTNGHVLPAGVEQLHDFEIPVPVLEQRIITAGEVRPLMRLADGVVESVRPLGTIDAVRLWTAHPDWLTTASGLSIGSRWHEILPGWAVVADLEQDSEVLCATVWSGARWTREQPAAQEGVSVVHQGNTPWETARTATDGGRNEFFAAPINFLPRRMRRPLYARFAAGFNFPAAFTPDLCAGSEVCEEPVLLAA
jgi:hypothetical protein